MLPFNASYGIMIRHKQTNEYMLVKSKTTNLQRPKIFWRNSVSRWHYSFDSRACTSGCQRQEQIGIKQSCLIVLRVCMPEENDLLLCCCHVPSIVGKSALFCALAYLMTYKIAYLTHALVFLLWLPQSPHAHSHTAITYTIWS